ncbi:response regulator [Variovorax sp. YR216]|uniref:response regulator n=1 Tax=Variovorax sp. YR216 TaxID=1882828 RepID=UPI00089BAB80|nr:response regulator [Variovorax sp. YR216]SEB04873.1 His Kinase A (phospho-acceptor) domain-containing protein [Variovorax sp. YR216]
MVQPPDEGAEPVDILIVDDLPEKLLVFRTVLEDLGQNLVAVRSGAEALREILKREFAVILLDVNMPDLDGFETAALIRKHRRSAYTPIIFITSYWDEVQSARGYSLGAVDFIISPVVPEVLRSKVGVFVSLYQMKRQIQVQADSRAAVMAAEAARRVAEENDRRSAFLAHASRTLGGTLEIDRAMAQLAELLVPAFGSRAVVRLIDAESEVDGWCVAEETGGGVRIRTNAEPGAALEPAVEALLRKVIDSGHAVEIDSAREGRGDLPWAWMAAVPLASGDRRLGALWVALDEGRAWPHATAAGVLGEVAVRASVAFENARLYGLLQREIVERQMVQQELQLASRRKDEFLAMMSHELRNPLASIATAIEVIRRIAPNEGKLTWAIDVASRQSRQMTRLIEELLDVSRISEGKIVLKYESFELRHLVAQSVETVRAAVERHRQTLSVHVPDEPLWVRGDVARLTQVISNLLHNASKYSAEGKAIALHARREGEEIVLTVHDQGMGIEPELLPRIFDLFAQGQRGLDRAQGGLGVGLTLARRLTHLHGGDIEAFSEGKDRGSIFKVRLPCANEAGAVEPSGASEPAPRAAGRRVLVVDDNLDAAAGIEALLHIDGHEVRVALDGEQGLEIFVDFEPAVVILDIGLPKIDGYEVARRMRAMPQGRGVLLIALTGYGQAEDRQAALDAGFDRHFVKPADAQQLLACIREWRNGGSAAEAQMIAPQRATT